MVNCPSPIFASYKWNHDTQCLLPFLKLHSCQELPFKERASPVPVNACNDAPSYTSPKLDWLVYQGEQYCALTELRGSNICCCCCSKARDWDPASEYPGHHALAPSPLPPFGAKEKEQKEVRSALHKPRASCPVSSVNLSEEKGQSSLGASNNLAASP